MESLLDHCLIISRPLPDITRSKREPSKTIAYLCEVKPWKYVHDKILVSLSNLADNCKYIVDGRYKAKILWLEYRAVFPNGMTIDTKK